MMDEKTEKTDEQLLAEASDERLRESLIKLGQEIGRRRALQLRGKPYAVCDQCGFIYNWEQRNYRYCPECGSDSASLIEEETTEDESDV